VGAITAIRKLNYSVLRDEGAPALRKLVASRAEVDALPGWLTDMLSSKRAVAIGFESKYAEHYTTRRKASDELDFLSRGLAVSMFGNCVTLRPDLGVRDDDGLLLTMVPTMLGACQTTACAGMSACPLHASGKNIVSAETFMDLFQKVFRSLCCGEPVWLGRHIGPWYNFQDWYAMELGHVVWSWSVSETLTLLKQDTLLQLLLRLSRRGAAIGWAEGGYSEGLLGWLDPDETAVLVSTLEPYPRSRWSEIPATLRMQDPHCAEVRLPIMRENIAKLHAVATTAARENVGIALLRS